MLPVGRTGGGAALEIHVDTVTVHPERTFTIARGSSDSFERVIPTLREAGLSGRGEAAPTGRYGQDAAGVAAALRGVSVRDPWDIEGTLRSNGSLPPSGLAALDAALYDLAARRLGVPVYRLLGLARPEPVTAYTLGISDPGTTVEEARRLSGRFPILKVKVGGWEEIGTVRAVAEAVPGAELWVDANEAFSSAEAVEAAGELAAAGVAVIEQPTPASEGPEALRAVREGAGGVPVVADESCLTARDVPPLAGCVDGVNVKLAKCGGLRGALAVVHTARAHGMRLMLGCMVETALGICTAAQVSGLFDFVDLDGSLLLADDPFSGPAYDGARMILPETPGLGVEGP
ncbi:MAG: dipeptide epimerase [Rubrobacter sp.]|nr:dipeptide epimerase [Rubrobacter sp.]